MCVTKSLIIVLWICVVFTHIITKPIMSMGSPSEYLEEYLPKLWISEAEFSQNLLSSTTFAYQCAPYFVYATSPKRSKTPNFIPWYSYGKVQLLFAPGWMGDSELIISDSQEGEEQTHWQKSMGSTKTWRGAKGNLPEMASQGTSTKCGGEDSSLKCYYQITTWSNVSNQSKASSK